MGGLRLEGRRAVVTGASRGIGRAIAVGLVEAGAQVSVCGRDTEALEETRQAMMAQGARIAHTAVCDVSNAAALQAYVAAAADALGGVDILINNASAFSRTDDAAGWRTAFETDLMSVVNASKSALPWLEQAGDGAIVHIGSISAFKPTANAMPYGAIKAAISQYVQSQAIAYAPMGIRVNAIAPGSVTFPGHFYEQRKLSGDPEYERVRAKSLFGRLGNPDEIADTVLFMASPMSRWVTGRILVVDGGQTLNP